MSSIDTVTEFIDGIPKYVIIGLGVKFLLVAGWTIFKGLWRVAIIALALFVFVVALFAYQLLFDVQVIPDQISPYLEVVRPS